MNRDSSRFGHGRHQRLGFVAGFAVVTALLVAPVLAAELKPQAYDRQIARTVAKFLTDEHLSKQPLNAEMSKRAFTTFMKSLDPMKVYFTQADYDEFAKQQSDISDLIKKGDTNFAYTVFTRFLNRVDERVKMVDSILGDKMDFTVEEDIMTDPKLTTYAKDDAELREKWRKRIKYDLLVKMADNTDGKTKGAKSGTKSTDPKPNEAAKPELTPQQKETAAREKISKRYHGFAKRMHQTTSEELLERYLTALSTGFDPHTDYMSPSTLEDFAINMRLSLEGIGAALEFELDEGCTKISRLIPGGPAEKDGRLKPEDHIVGVGQGIDGEIADVSDMDLKEVVSLIRGKAGTIVRLKATPAIGGETKIIDITRASIELQDAAARSEIFEEGTKSNGKPYKVGVIDLPSFYMDMDAARLGKADYRSTTRDMKRLLEEFKAKGVDAVILDLRRNGGGSLVEAVDLTGLFIDDGTVVQVRDPNNKVQHYDDPEKGVSWGGPLVVLQSKFSASASEIFAGAIQDYGRGLVVGDRTSHGKGTVQQLMDVSRPLFQNLPNAPQMGALKITIQQFYRPNGDSTQNRGVVSDVELPSLTTHFDVGESDLDYALKFDHIDAAPFQNTHMVDKPLIDELKTRSAKRVQESEDFQKLEKRITHYVEAKSRKTVPLNQEKFLAERKELNAEQEEEKQFEQLDDPNRPVVKRDFYFNEAIAITLDYLQLNMKLASTGATNPSHRVISIGQ